MFFSVFVSATPPPQNCSIGGSVYTSDKQVVESFPFHVDINPPPSQASSMNASYAVVDIEGNVIELTLLNIPSIPPSLYCLEHLQKLSLLDSPNLSITSDILRFGFYLTSFTASNISTSLTLPPEFYNLTLLTTLTIVNCGLQTLSENIINLGRLTELVLDQNQLTSLPSALGRMQSLTSLSVNGNPHLSSLDILNGSKTLTTLRGSNCMISHLPANIHNLSTIEMNSNQLTSLDGIEMLAATSSDSFSFAYNKITSIGTTSFGNIESLNCLNLSNNLLTTLTESLYQIKDLQTLDVQNNNFTANEKEWILGIFRLTNTTVNI